jgi:hypothetical protein
MNLPGTKTNTPGANSQYGGNACQNQKEPRIDIFMAGKKGQSGPAGNANAFRHDLAAVDVHA